MRSPRTWLSLAWSLALLCMATVPAQAETYTELFIGGVHTANEFIPFSLLHRYPNGVSAENAAVPGRVHLAINLSGLGGVRFGTWFVKEGFPGFKYPEWSATLVVMWI